MEVAAERQVVGQRMRQLAALIVMAAVFSGCGTSNLYAARPLLRLETPHPGGRAFVTNPQLVEEYEILAASGIFDLVEHGPAPKSVRLHRMQRDFVCGNPYLLTVFTLGLIPATVPAGVTFSFSATESGETADYQFHLDAERRISPLQYPFKPFLSEQRTLGSVLASEYAASPQTLPDRALEPTGGHGG